MGGAIRDALLASGHEVVAALREPSRRTPIAGVTYRELDFMNPPEPAGVVDLVGDVDALVNAVGIIREAKGLTFQKLHTETPLSLFAAAQAAGISRIVQISAAGTSYESPFEYFRSKAKADAYLIEKCKVPSVILRPSLIYGERGEATALFHQLAALPVLPLPAGGNFSFRPILVEDVAQLTVEALTRERPPTGIVEVGGADEMTLKEILLAIRTKMKGKSAERASTLSIPKLLMKPAAWFGDLTGAGPLTSDMLDMLVSNEAPDLGTMRRSFDYRPRGLKSVLLGTTD